MIRTAHRLVLVLLAAVVATVILGANPAAAAKAKAPANVAFSWSTDAPAGTAARTSTAATLTTGESVTVTAKFGKRCMNRRVKFESKIGTGDWMLIGFQRTGTAPSVAFSSAAYLPGEVSYRVTVGKTRHCAARTTAAAFTIVAAS